MFKIIKRRTGKRYSLYKGTFYNPHTREIELKTFKCKNMIELENKLSILNRQGYEYDPTLIPFQKVSAENWEERHEKSLVK